MEFFYFCGTCQHVRNNKPAGLPMSDTWVEWCSLHERRLPKEVGKEHLICCEFSPRDARATEWKKNITLFPKGERWSWTMYLSSYKFSFLSDLPKVDPNTGQLIES